MSQKAIRLLNTFIVVFLVAIFAGYAQAASTTSLGCNATSFSASKDLCWDCMYPIKLATVTVKKDPFNYGGKDEHNKAFCSCTYDFFPYYRAGMTLTYWEPLRYIETVKVPYCFPGMGSQMSRGDNASLYGGKASKAGTSMAAQIFAQAHDWSFHSWSILGLMLDSSCVEYGSFDLKYLTETDAAWNDGEVDTIVDSEKLIFANPVSVLACAIDAAAATFTFPLDVMFWCEGSWGPVYPITGNMYNSEQTVANAAIAGRLIFKLTKEFQIWDGAVELCHYTPTYYWFKSHYKIQPVRPIAATNTCIPLGKPGFLWSAGKNPPGTSGGNSNDNFVWMIFSKKECCSLY